MDQSINLSEIVEKHGKWLRDEKGGERWSCPIGANLRRADLSRANLSRAKNLFNCMQWMKQNFEHDDLGWIVYKTFGAYMTPPDDWNIENGSYIEENVNPQVTNDCGSGINFATMKWIKSDTCANTLEVWRCRIRWMDACSIVVPYNTDGKARCGRLELIEVVKN